MMAEEKLMFKTCKLCGEMLSVSKFSKSRYSRDGLKTVCKRCEVTKAKQKEPQKLRIITKSLDELTPEQLLNYGKMQQMETIEAMRKSQNRKRL